MKQPRKTSIVILITLAELAWLAAFGLLFAYRGKVGELGKAEAQLSQANKDLAVYRDSDTNRAALVERLNSAEKENRKLGESLNVFTNLVPGKAAAEVARLVALGADAEKKIAESAEKMKQLREELQKQEEMLAESRAQMQATNDVLADLWRKWVALPPNAVELAGSLKAAQEEIVRLNKSLENCGNTNIALSNQIVALKEGEVAIRRELIGLPTKDLNRVVFIVDTSSSMRNSPAWNEARNLMRIWIEYLSVEECALINFNDGATSFPTNGYVRLRESNRTSLVQTNMDALLKRFNNVPGGTYSDFYAGLALAYQRRPAPDLIVVFTDGHPHVATRTDTAYGEAILTKVATNVPILTVAVGSYEVENPGAPNERRNRAITFLKQVAAKSGGNFIGR